MYLGILPNALTYSGSLIGLSWHIFQQQTAQAFIGLTIGFLTPWTFNQLYQLTRKKSGLGLGDCKMLAMLGAWLGAHCILPILTVASIMGSLGAYISTRDTPNRWQTPLPFGPWLALATLMTLALPP